MIDDGRRTRRFKATNGIANLRLRVVGEGVFAAVTTPSKGEPHESEPAAIDLWRELCEQVMVLHVPAARDASSDRFKSTITKAIHARLAERAIHEVQGGSPAEYRKMSRAVTEISEVGNELVAPLWDELSQRLPFGLVQTGEFSVAPQPQDLVDWLVECTDFRISTGDHDERSVRPGEVGSGLQSLLDLAVFESLETWATTSWILLEEPEAFLHPAAQRQVARELLADRSAQRVVSTHSPIVVDEAKFGQVVLVKDHEIFEPNAADDQREEINTALLTGGGAEALFSESVLLVEGPGDRAFFETMRQRISRVDDSGRSQQLGIISVGGKRRFRPWIELFQSYANSQGELPIRWLAVADSTDAAGDMGTGLREAGITLPQPVSDLLRRIQSTFKQYGTKPGIAITRELNKAAAASEARLNLLPVDLEYAMLSSITTETAHSLCDEIDFPPLDGQQMMVRLGSKVEGSAVDKPAKDPWIRSKTALKLPAAEISSDVRLVLQRWLAGVMTAQEASKLVKAIT